MLEVKCQGEQPSFKMNCKVIPLKNYSEISYRVKCVTVENEKVFGDVFITHQTRDLDYPLIGYPIPAVHKTKKRNLIEHRLECPDFMEMNKKPVTRRASEITTAAIRRQTRRIKSMDETHSIKQFQVIDVRNNISVRSLKKYPAPLALEGITKQEVRVSSLVDQLLLDIYGFPSGSRSESDSTASSLRQHPQHQYLQKARLLLKSQKELQILIKILHGHISHTGGLLVRQLRKKDYLMAKRDKQCEIITAHLQAYSEKRIEDTKMRFSLTPQPGESGFQQWLDAMKMVARLPGGIPAEFRKRLWLTLAERHLEQRGVDWKQAEKVCFNEWSNPDDEELGIQIVKDLHRTGCSLFCGAAGRDNQAVLRRVLLGFARWNKSVGYCQGLNVLAALVLQVMDRAESSAVKVMIFLIEGVLPEGYFADNLRGLSVDMAVFRDLLRARMPKLSKHLEALQSDAKDKATGNSYEPPLTNVFTMQWFLTLFCHCLPQDAVLRVWDLIFLEGDEVLLRTALAIWESLSDRIMTVTSADEFYSIMGVLTREMLEFTDTNNLIKNIVSLGPLHGVTGLREKHRYNITPWARKLSDDEDSDTEEDERLAVAAAMFSMAQRLKKGELLSEHISSTVGAIQAMAPGSDRERLALDISTLKQQYAKLRERQRQAHIILSAACARQSMVPPPASQAMNHLLVGKNALVSGKNRQLNLASATTPSKTRPAVLHSPRTQTRKERQQGVTLHWKDTKRQKQKCPETVVVETAESKKTSVESPEETTDDVTSPKSGGVESDSDSTSTELCDEPDRFSDVDSEEQTSVSDNYYVMASEEERSGKVEGSSTSGNSPVRSPRDVATRIEKSMTISRDVVEGDAIGKGEEVTRQEKTKEGVSPELTETSIAKITDQIRRLSAEDDNNTMVPQILSGASKTDDSVIRTSIGDEAKPSKYENGVDGSAADRKRGDSSFDASDDRDYFQFSYDRSKIGNSKIIEEEDNEVVETRNDVGEKANDPRPITEIKVEDYDQSIGTSDKVDKLVSKKLITVTDVASKYDAASVVQYYDKDNEYLDGKEKRFKLSLDSYEVGESADATDKFFETSLDTYRSIKSPEVSEKNLDISIDDYKPIKLPDKKEKDFEAPLDSHKSIKSPDTNDKRFVASLESYKVVKLPDKNEKRFEVSGNSYKSLESLGTDNKKQFETTLDTYEPLASLEKKDKHLETSLDTYKTLKSPDKDKKRLETSLDTYKSLKLPDKNEKRLETSLDNYTSLKSPDKDKKRLETSLDTYKSLKSPDQKEKRLETSLDTYKSLKSPDQKEKRLETSLDTYKSLKSPDQKEKRLETSLDSYKPLKSSEKNEIHLESSLDTFKSLKSPDKDKKRLETSLDTSKSLKSPDKNDKHMETSLDTYTPLKSPKKNEIHLETSSVSYEPLKSPKKNDKHLETSLDIYRSLKSPDKNEKLLGKSLDNYKSIKSPDKDEQRLEASLDTYKSLKSPDTSEKRLVKSLDTYKSLKSPDKDKKRLETSLATYKSLKSPDKAEKRLETTLDNYKSVKLLDTAEERFETSLNSYKSLKSPDKSNTRFETSLESSKIVITPVLNDKPFEISLDSYKSIKSPVASSKIFETSLHPYKSSYSSSKQNLSDASPTNSIHTGQPFYSKTYVMGHLPISPITVDQKISTLNKISYNIDKNTIVTLETSKNSDDSIDRPTFSDKLQTIETKSYTETTKKSPRTPESSKSFSSGETMGPDSKPSSLTVSPRTPVKSASREFSVDKSMCSSISSDSKTLILQSTESDVARESPRLDAKKSSYEKSSPSTPISTDSLKNKSEASPKLIVSSDSCDSCSPSKVKSSERSFSSDLQSPISANSIKYTSTYGKRGQDNISDSSIDLSTAVSPFYPIAHPNQKTPSPYSVSRRRCSTDSADTSPEQRLSVSKESVSKYSSKLDTSLKMENRETNGISKKSDAYVRPQFTSGKDNLCLNLLGRDKDRSDRRIYELGANELYGNDQNDTEDNTDDQLSEKDTVPQLPQEQLDKHFMNLNYRHKDRSKNFERSSSSLDRRFNELKSSASTDEFSTSIAKKRSSDILEDMKHLEAKAFGDGPAESGMLTKKTSYIWEDFKNLEARRQDNFSNSASNFSKHRLDVPDINVTNEGRKSYVVHPKINIDEGSDSILKTVSCKKSTTINGDDEEDDGRESKLGVWTKVKPRKRGNNGRRSSDRALKIIQENSAILHKILACQAKKRLPDLEEISKEITISPINEEISKIFSPILEKMGLNEHEINEELARINFKDFDSMAATSVSEFDAKINDELSKLSLIDDTEEIDDLDVDEIISHEYLDTREALIDRKINEELSKLLANYEEEPRLSMATLEKGSSSQNISDTEGLDLTSISTNVFSYKSSNDSIETRSDQGSLQEPAIQSERFPQYAQPMIPYATSTYVQDLSPKSDIDIYRELEKLDKISSAQVLPDTSPDISPKTLSPVTYVPSVSPYSDVPGSMRYSPKAMPFDSSPLKNAYDPYKSFDFRTNLSPRRVPSNPYTPRAYDNVTDSNYEYFDHKTGLCPTNSYDVHLKSPILTKESLEFRVRYDNESPRKLVAESFALPSDVVNKQLSIEKNMLYYSESNKIVTPTKYSTKESRPPLQDVIGSSFLDYPTESTLDLLHRKYESLSPRNYTHEKSPEYERPYPNIVETEANVGTYLPVKHRDYQPTLSPNRQFDQPFPPARNYFAAKLSPGIGDETKRPVSHPEFPDKVTIGQYPEPPSRGSSCYKKSSLSLGNIGRTNKNGHGDNLNATPSPKAQFSPFPVKNTSKKPKELALKLGLYSPKSSASGPLRRS